MKVAIMQPYFFPYIGYFQLINAVDVFVIYDDVNFIKKGWINRNNILNNNKKQLFTIPLQNASQNKLINDIFLSQDNKWKISFLKSIEFSYKKSIHYSNFFPILKDIVLYDNNNLSEYIFYSLVKIAEYLNIGTTIKLSSNYYYNREVKGSKRILAICNALKADVYINAIGGQELYNKRAFDDENISLNFLKSNCDDYKQFENDFTPFLSIIDVLMFNSPDEINLMLNQYELV